MDNQNEKDRCVNCGIRSVPLYLGLDNRLHCADHIGLLLPPDKPEQPAEEIALETGRTKTQVLGDMVQFAYDHIELYEEGEA